MQKSRKGKQLKTLPNLHPQTYITQISQIFHNPNELCYILIDCENHIRMYDIPTMAILGRSEVKVRQGFEVWRCLFDRNDVGVFYTIMRSKGEIKKSQQQGKGQGESHCHSYVVNAHYLNRNLEILWKTCPIQLTSKQLFEEEISDEVNMDDIPKELKLIESKMSQKEPMNQNIPNEIYVFEDEEVQQEPLSIRMDEEDNNMKQIMPQRRDSEDIDIELSGYEESKGEGEEQNVIGQVLGEDSVEKQLPNKAHTHFGGYQFDDNFPNLIQVEAKFNPEPTQQLWDKKQRILEASKYIHSRQGIDEAEFTILTNKGLLMCSESGVKKHVEIEGDLVVGGSSFYGNGECFSEKGEIGDMWILFGRETCFLLETHPVVSNQLGYNENHYPKIYETLSIKLHPFSHYKKVYTDNRKKLCLIVNTDNELVLISYGQKGSDSERNLLEVISKINMNNMQNGEMGVKIENLSFFGILRFGSDTSTSDKYENKIMILLGVSQVSAEQLQAPPQPQPQPNVHVQQQIQVQPELNNQAQSLMISQAAELEQVNPIESKQPQIQKVQKPLSTPIQKPLPKLCDVHIYSLDLSQPFSPLSQLPQMIFSNPPASLHECPKQLVTILPSFPECLEIWYNEYLENRLHFLDTNNKVHMIDMCRLLQGKNIGKQWVNLGYKFEALDGNQLYEELEDEFQVTAEESKSCNDVDGKRGMRISQLDDWSYCMVSKEAIVSKKLKRLNCIEF